MSGLVLVSGLCRCGSSLMMQMLTAGGWPAFDAEHAPWPGFEHPMNNNSDGWPLPPDPNGVMKWLDPPHFRPPFKRVRGSIFLTRNHGQQARSHIKFLRALGMNVWQSEWRGVAASFRDDERKSRAILAKLGPVLTVTFEALVTKPRDVLGAVAVFIDEPLDVEVAARQLRPRVNGAAVLPFMLETQLLAEGAPR